MILLSGLTFLAQSATAQAIINTVAGSTFNFFDRFTPGGPATSAPLGSVEGGVVDPGGNVIVADEDNCLGRRFLPPEFLP